MGAGGLPLLRPPPPYLGPIASSRLYSEWPAIFNHHVLEGRAWWGLWLMRRVQNCVNQTKCILWRALELWNPETVWSEMVNFNCAINKLSSKRDGEQGFRLNILRREPSQPRRSITSPRCRVRPWIFWDDLRVRGFGMYECLEMVRGCDEHRYISSEEGSMTDGIDEGRNG